MSTNFHMCMSQITIPPNSRESPHMFVFKKRMGFQVYTPWHRFYSWSSKCCQAFSACVESGLTTGICCPSEGSPVEAWGPSQLLLSCNSLFWKLSSINTSGGLVGWILPNLPKNVVLNFPFNSGKSHPTKGPNSGPEIIAFPSAFLNFQINQVQKCSKGRFWFSSLEFILKRVTWQFKPTLCFLEEPKDMKPSWHPVLPHLAAFQRFHCTLKSECSLHLECFWWGLHWGNEQRGCTKKVGLKFSPTRAVSQHLGPEINGFPAEMNRIF